MLDPTLSDWLDRQADALDRGDADPAAPSPRPSTMPRSSATAT
ncbi:hypothetical protein, partial [Pseudomonas aeruginosa]